MSSGFALIVWRVNLEEGLLLLQVFGDHGTDVVRFTVGAQFVGSSAPVLLSLVFLLQALQHTADLSRQTHLSRGENIDVSFLIEWFS